MLKYEDGGKDYAYYLYRMGMFDMLALWFPERDTIGYFDYVLTDPTDYDLYFYNGNPSENY